VINAASPASTTTGFRAKSRVCTARFK